MEQTKEMARIIRDALEEKKGEDVRILDISEVSVLADYFIIANGTSSTHVRALADEIDEEMAKLGATPDHIEGRATGWILLDYGCVLVHVFDPQSREYYNLDRLWGDAAKIDISDIVTPD